MKISVALCTFNGEKYIGEQLESILAQTCAVDEIVIGDDGSTDRTLSIIENVLGGSGISYRIFCNEKNLGFRKNFESTIRKTSGDIIFLCDQDDVWLPDKVRIMMKVMEEEPLCLMAFSDAYITDAKLNIQSRSLWESKFYLENRERFSDTMDLLLSGYYVTGAASCIRRELFEKCSDFSEIWVHDGWLAVHAALYGKLEAVPEKLIYYRQHGANQVGASAENTVSAWIKNKVHVLQGGAKSQMLLHKDSCDRWKEFYRLRRQDMTKDMRKKVLKAVRVHDTLNSLPKMAVGKRVFTIMKMFREGAYCAYYRRGRSCMLADFLFLSVGR